ncbi:hypothetical protein SLE2022_140980 [Rubroshorea leprosula]
MNFLSEDQMANYKSPHPPPSYMWWVHDDYELSQILSSEHSIKNFSQETPTPMSSPMNGPVFLPGSSPEDRARIGNASPETARHVALRTYESMKRQERCSMMR